MEMVKLLIDHNADLAVEYGERTAVEFARDHNQLDIADYIKGLSGAPSLLSFHPSIQLISLSYIAIAHLFNLCGIKF